MHGPALRAFVHVACVLLVALCPGRAHAQGILTVGAAVIGAKFATDHAAKRLKEVGSDLADDIDRRLGTRIHELDEIVKNDLTKPIDELTGEVRRAADELVAITNQVNAIVDRLQTCLDITVSQAVQQLGAVAANFGAENVPFSSSRPRITAVVPIDGRPLLVRPSDGSHDSSTPRLIALRGSFTRYDASCGDSRLFVSRPAFRDLGEATAVTRELAIRSADAQEVRADFPDDAFRFGGVYTFTYVFPSKSTLSCGPNTARFAMLIPSEAGAFALATLSIVGSPTPPLQVVVGGGAGDRKQRRLDATIANHFGSVPPGASWILGATATWPQTGFIDLGKSLAAAQQRTLSEPSGFYISWTPDAKGGELLVQFPKARCTQ